MVELIRVHGDHLHQLAYRLTGEHHAAQDLVQSTVLVLLRRGRLRRQIGGLYPYARRVLTNLHIDRHRVLASTERVVDTTSAVAGRAASGHLADEVVDRLTLLGALERLSPRQRAVVVLRYYEDLPDPQIAAILGIDRATVRSIAARSLALLRNGHHAATKEDEDAQTGTT
ncbi:sigma-70 family RNA polymerase sigma factor [Nakamurella alba]|uniref:sigma-70 family RNA polymerase sigma factor n=1 Tax=Nakamurella alba TaxID=2665158 RepID=UPI0018AB02F4|nr:sigma-70 family RNA polymerase sigma factor [Nakamurella alba]